MDYQECLYDISIAKNALSQSLLDVAVQSENLICEVYCIASFHQTFYLQVYGGTQYTLLFAKPLFGTPHGLTSCSAPFSATIEAERHIAYRGDIYCGMSYLPKNHEIINTLEKCLPSVTEILPESQITIDGATTLIVNHLLKDPVTLYFRNEELFERNVYAPEEVQFLHKLASCMETIVGNLTRSNR